jgi:hypothetical protein
LVLEITQLLKDEWEFAWPVKFDLGEILRLGPSLLKLLAGERPEWLSLRTGDKKISAEMNDLKTIRDFLACSPLDFEVELSAKGITLTFLCDSVDFPERQGTDLYVRVVNPTVQSLVEAHMLTARCNASWGAFTALLEEALRKDRGWNDSSKERIE